MRAPTILIATAVALAVLPLRAQDRAQAFTGARIIPIEGDEIPDGTLVVQAGKIVSVGPASRVEIPEDAERHDVSGKIIMPGLICTHSHIGGPSGADRSGPVQPECRVLDSVNVRDVGFRKAHAGGLTTLNVMPGSGHLCSGQTVYLKLRRDPVTIEDLLLETSKGVTGGLKMANGTNSQSGPPFPGTRGKSAAVVRALFVRAQGYQRKLEAAKRDPAKRPDRDLALEALVECLEGKRVVHHHTHRHDDVMTVIRLSKEFGFRVVLHHVSDAWRVADEIGKAGVPCSIIMIDSPGGKIEAKDIDWSNGAALEKAGVLTGFHTDDGITDSRFFMRSAALAVRAGMSRKAALFGLTLAGAEMLDLGDRTGSLKAGKDADFIVLSGDPLSVYTKVEQTWVEGVQVFDRRKPEDRLYAVGGFGASAGQVFTICSCFGHPEDHR